MFLVACRLALKDYLEIDSKENCSANYAAQLKRVQLGFEEISIK